MITKHTAIRNLYPSVTSVLEEGEGNFTCKDKDGKSVSIDVDTVNAEFAKLEYKNKRQNEYPSVVDQLDDIYHNGIDGWKATIKTTKDKYPKS
jgi:hypothetical protein